ncbi:purine-nucleoside phosphorylase, partial [Pseudomonas poae]
GRVVAICPEVSGGLPTPRPPAEIAGGQGVDVWEGRARVLTAEGEDFSVAFLDGARQALALVQRHGIRIAILKANSPSCGNRLIYDGTFSGLKVSGEGVTAALLKHHGVLVFSEQELPEAVQALAQL